MEDKSSIRERINSNPSRTEMTLFALALGAISGVLVYLFDVFALPLISGPRFAESTPEVSMAIFFGGLSFVGALFWAGVGRFIEENCPGFRGDSE